MWYRFFISLFVVVLATNYTWAQDSLYIKVDRKNRVKELGTLVNSKREGVFFKYKRNGKHKTFFYENGKKRKVTENEITVENIYDPASKGQIIGANMGVTKNQKREGLWLSFDSELLSKAVFYKEGVLKGTAYRFHSDGEILGIDRYVNGKKHGFCEEFHSGGDLHYRVEYKKGSIVDGKHIYYYPNGNTKLVNNYKNGKKFGKSITYYESGAIEIEGEYRDKGLAEGPWKEYFEDGTLKEEYYYKHGLFHGEYTIYDENGKIVAQYIYRNDKLIKTILN
jgi:antitoxin component YwqK of YwqJK toxin-antitoxin module